MINEYLKFYEDMVQAIKQTIKEQRKAGGKNIEISEIDKFAREEVIVALIERVRQLEHELRINEEVMNHFYYPSIKKE